VYRGGLRRCRFARLGCTSIVSGRSVAVSSKTGGWWRAGASGSWRRKASFRLPAVLWAGTDSDERSRRRASPQEGTGVRSLPGGRGAGKRPAGWALPAGGRRRRASIWRRQRSCCARALRIAGRLGGVAREEVILRGGVRRCLPRPWRAAAFASEAGRHHGSVISRGSAGPRFERANGVDGSPTRLLKPTRPSVAALLRDLAA